MVYRAILVLILSLWASSSFALQEQEILALLEQTDDLYRHQSSAAELEMTIETPEWKRTLLLESWSKGRDLTLIRILAPAKERGVATLKKGQEMWNYFPKVNQVIKIPSSMMMGSWMGSDFTHDDLVREFRYSEDFFIKALDQGRQWMVTLVPKQETISLWGRIELTLDKASELPTRELFYDEKGVLIREMSFSDVRTVGTLKVPHHIELIPIKEKGHKTSIRYLKLKFGVPLEDAFFSRQNLQKRI